MEHLQHNPWAGVAPLALQQHGFDPVNRCSCSDADADVDADARVSFLKNSVDFVCKFHLLISGYFNFFLFKKSDTKNHFFFHFWKRVKGITFHISFLKESESIYNFPLFLEKKRVELCTKISIFFDKNLKLVEKKK